MEVCSECGKNSLFPEKYGRIALCKVCAMKILSPTWKNKEYSSNEDVEKQKEKVIKLANTSKFSTDVIEGLSDFFDSKKIKELIKVFDGHRGQVLTVCETYCVINTTGAFDYQKTEKAYLRFMKIGKRGKSAIAGAFDDIINSQMAVGIIGDVIGGSLPGGGAIKRQIKKVGKSFAMNAIAKQIGGGDGQVDYQENKIVMSVHTGERVIKYSDYDHVKFMEPVGEEEYGFIKLQNSKFAYDSDEDVLFFFGSGTDTIKEASQLFGFIKRKVDSINKVMMDSKASEETAKTQQVTASSTADELLKFKQLLDMGAITQEEYDTIKKQLLGL